ncbi:hypothetical protein SBRY_20188 [Actinacidiphila bryophytorum]|uniref:Uncharacterized protein n=1 Tax=Actinacidiphila bryophytorum TaxID=1436133 RepID=A0A9W4E6A2_9ACTN|nr:hypothetical protein SBRY_20188 [Actinacidiphila bryophytorum]
MTSTATTRDVPAVITKAAAQVPPPSPIRSRPTKVSTAPGGWPAMCVVQFWGEPIRMWSVYVRSAGPRSSKRCSCVRYSPVSSSRPAMPRRQPSTRASDQVHAIAAAHPDHSSPRQGSRTASGGPYATTRTATVTARGVPGPVCGRHHASRGGRGDLSTGLSRWSQAPIPARTAKRSSAAPAAATSRRRDVRPGRRGRWPLGDTAAGPAAAALPAGLGGLGGLGGLAEKGLTCGTLGTRSAAVTAARPHVRLPQGLPAPRDDVTIPS